MMRDDIDVIRMHILATADDHVLLECRHGNLRRVSHAEIEAVETYTCDAWPECQDENLS